MQSVTLLHLFIYCINSAFIYIPKYLKKGNICVKFNANT